ncbi:AAA family ATPase [Nocardia farcinica]|uniref:AAA family ATPase n=1 Tax=Nocardia farcinica TaxID=37329 RepID=UPI002453FF27|nr:AAA family ATPase [Nocardia farcinica]
MTLYVVIGPPAAGKSTWCQAHATPADIIIDYDRIASALTARRDAGHDHTPAVKAVTKAARRAAIDTAIQHAREVDVYLIHSTPSPTLLASYRALGARVVTIDPGREIVMRRVKAERPWRMQQVVKQWYEQRPELVRGAPPPTGPESKPSQVRSQLPTGNTLDWHPRSKI